MKTKKQYELIFDNGGTLTLQTDDFVHCYYYTDEYKQGAEDLMNYLRGDNVREWDGNQPECRLTYDVEIEQNGGYRWFDSIREISRMCLDLYGEDDDSDMGVFMFELWQIFNKNGLSHLYEQELKK